MAWDVQDGKRRLLELVQRACRGWPVPARGRTAADVLVAEGFDPLAARPSLVDHLLSGPAWSDDMVEAVNARAKAPSRGACQESR